MRRATMATAAALMLGFASLGACATPVDSVSPGGPGSQVDEEQRLQQQAADALRRWDEAVAAAGGLSGFALVSEGTTIVGAFEPQLAESGKLALTSGAIELAGVSGSQTIPDGQVVWADGSTQAVRTVTVEEALLTMRQAAGASTCDGCTPLRIVGAIPVTEQVETTRGPATAPAWEFTLAGTSVKLRQVAVARAEGVQVTPPPWDATNPPAGLSIDSAVVSVDGRELTVHFTGSRGTGDQKCGYDYTAEAVESASAVVVIVRSFWSWTPGANEACPSIGYPRKAVATLAGPLEDRAVLEVRTGMPVPVRQA